MSFKEKILSLAKANPRRLVLPEGRDIRVLKAAEMIMREKFTTELYVLGNPDELRAMAVAEGISLDGVILYDQTKSPKLPDYIHRLYES
ncbi:MAG: phosphate acyltransferase, partial [Brevinematales bacterium]